jgi:serine-type D-Ala-D-Ala carboxypeptidase (penicillin-binding protein 5/6)
MRLIAVVLGSSSDANRTAANQALLTYGFRFYETHKLYAAGATIASPRVWLGTHETINLGSKQDIYLTTPIGRYADLKASVNLDKQLRAPIQKGEAVGKLLLKIQDKTLAEVPLLALNSNPKGSFVQRLRDRIALSWQHMWHTDDALS